MYYNGQLFKSQPLLANQLAFFLWLFCHSSSPNLWVGIGPELFIHIELNQFSLDLRDQVSMILVNYESNWATAPSSSDIKVCKPTAVVLILGVEYYPRTTV